MTEFLQPLVHSVLENGGHVPLKIVVRTAVNENAHAEMVHKFPKSDAKVCFQCSTEMASSVRVVSYVK